VKEASPRKAARFAEAIADAAGWLIYHIEHVAVLCFEGFHRLLLRADSRLYDRQARLTGSERGAAAMNGNRCAVFVVYCSGPLPEFTKCFVESLARAGYSVTIVTNTPLHPQARAFLLQECEWIIDRQNVGRDFGAYQDGIRFVQEHYPKLERMIVANDSVFYFLGRTDALVEALSSDHDLIGVSEVFEHHYHVASFLLSFGPAILRSDAFRNFWSRYLPLGTRRWAILRGEGILSRDLVRAGFKPHILWRARDLQEPLATLLPSELETLLGLIPRQSRLELYKEWGLPRPANSERALPFAQVADATRAIPPSTLARQIVERVEAHNQMHGGGILFQKYLGLPLMKRDLVYREVFTLDEMAQIVQTLPEELAAEIMRDFHAKGHPDQLGFADRALHRHSAI
jgi:hypothetical protein